jgi:hypothetical protein
MTRTFEPVTTTDAPTPTNATPADRRLPWWTFSITWTLILGGIPAIAHAVASLTGLLGLAYDPGGLFDVGSIAFGVFPAWLGGLAAVAGAWYAAVAIANQTPSRRRVVAAAIASHLSLGSFVALYLLAGLDFLAEAIWGGPLAAGFLGLLSVLALAGILAGARLLGASISTRRLLAPCLAVTVVAATFAPLASPTDPTDLAFGVSLWSAGALWFGLAAPRWFGPLDAKSTRPHGRR